MRNILTHFPWLFGTPVKTRVETDQYGITLISTQSVSNYLWQEVVRIDAFKEDRVTVDEVTLEFHLKSPGRVVQVSEDLVDFDKLVRFLEAEWPKISPDWRSNVVLPPFAESRVTLYSAAIK